MVPLFSRYGRCAEMQLEQSPQLPFANTEPRCKGVDVGYDRQSVRLGCKARDSKLSARVPCASVFMSLRACLAVFGLGHFQWYGQVGPLMTPASLSEKRATVLE